MCPVPKDAAHLTNAESQTIKEWEKEDCAARYHLSRQLPDHIFIGLIDHKTAKGRWDQLAEELGQPPQEASRTEGLTGEPPAATAEGSSRRRRRRMGKRRPTDTIHIADIEGEGCSLAEEGDTHVQIVSVEAVLSRQHPQTPDPIVHAQTVGTEPEAILGKPGAIEEGTHTHNDHVEPDLKEGQPGDPNANTPEGVTHAGPDSTPGEEVDPIANLPVHIEGTGPVVMLEEGGIAGENASVEGDRDPLVKLQEPGVSHLATPEKAYLLTSSPPLPTTPEAASTQRSLAVDTETPAIPVPDHGADLELQPHDALPPPNEAAEHPIHQEPEQIQAPTEVGGLLESLLGEASQCSMGQMVLTSAHALEGKTPIGEAHGRPPDTPDPQRQGSTAWEPMFAIPKARVRVHEARKPVLDMGAHTCPNPWPDLDAVIVNLDTCIGSASQLEGEQNVDLPCVGSELHAAPPAPQHFQSSLTPSHARIRCMEKVLPPSGVRSMTVPIPNPRNCLTRMAKVCRKQGECHQYWTTHLHSWKTLTLSDFLAQTRKWMLGESNPRASMRMNEGERRCSWVLHQPWPRIPSASDPLTRLRQPAPLSPRRWCHGHKKLGADVKSTRNHTRRCRRRASATQRRYHESASDAQLRANTNLFGCQERRHKTTRACLRCRHETTSTNAA